MKRESKYITPEERAILQEKLRYLLTVDGVSQKEAAILLDIDPNTIVRWLKTMKLKKAAKRKFQKEKRDKDSLNAFIISLKKDKDPLYPEIEKRYQKWLKPNLNPLQKLFYGNK